MPHCMWTACCACALKSSTCFCPPSPAGLDECPNCDSVFSSLESEQRETSRLTKENKALVNGIFQLQTEVQLFTLRCHFMCTPVLR